MKMAPSLELQAARAAITEYVTLARRLFEELDSPEGRTHHNKRCAALRRDDIHEPMKKEDCDCGYWTLYDKARAVLYPGDQEEANGSH